MDGSVSSPDLFKLFFVSPACKSRFIYKFVTVICEL